MSDTNKIHHTIKSKTASLKEAAELLQKCPDGKKREKIVLMRETAQDIVNLLTELESALQKT
ncbi:MAG: hypothetical protein HY746_04325 [Elusimicrobia bacterium]|nr:hypothetical protein [Elusimicrobiota bacterium]